MLPASLSGGIQYWIPPEREVFSWAGIFDLYNVRSQILFISPLPLLARLWVA